MSSSLETQVGNLVAGYISRNLVLRKYTSVSSIDLGAPSDPLAIQRLAEAVYALLWRYGTELTDRFSRRATRPAGVEGMNRILAQLSGHAMPLSPEVSARLESLNIARVGVRSDGSWAAEPKKRFPTSQPKRPRCKPHRPSNRSGLKMPECLRWPNGSKQAI